MLDFGCGYGTDLIRLATEHPELELAGYTISAGQAAFAREDAAKRGVASRAWRSSTVTAPRRVPAPPRSRDRPSRSPVTSRTSTPCRERGRALNDGGSCSSRTSWRAPASRSRTKGRPSSYLSPSEQWAAVFADHGLGVADVVDITRTSATSSTTPTSRRTLRGAPAPRGRERAERRIRSYDRSVISSAMGSRATCSSRHASTALSRDDLYRCEPERIDKPLLYPDVFEDDWTTQSRGHRSHARRPRHGTPRRPAATSSCSTRAATGERSRG